MKLIIVYYTWVSTATNHAGMAYLVKKLKIKYDRDIELVEIPSSINTWSGFKKSLFNWIFAWRLKKRYNHPNYSILFMEFFGGHACGNQTLMANFIRKLNFKGNLMGMVHLPPYKIKSLYQSEVNIRKKLNALDKVIVMGSTLQNFFEGLNPTSKIFYIPHYVENNYYRRAKIKFTRERLQLIYMGNLFRNINQLHEIVSLVKDVDFHICAGKKLNLYNAFKQFSHVKIYGYLKEDELLIKMQEADIGISVMEDTIGSNVITTSLAVGLPQIVSNVGSIHDYCDTNNTIFCNTTKDFIEAIHHLNNTRSLLTDMHKSALEKAKELDIETVMNRFKNQLIDNE